MKMVNCPLGDLETEFVVSTAKERGKHRKLCEENKLLSTRWCSKKTPLIESLLGGFDKSIAQLVLQHFLAGSGSVFLGPQREND